MPVAFYASEESGDDRGSIFLSDEATGALVTVAPELGGLVTQFDVGGQRVLYLDAETLRQRRVDPKRSIRGGCPVLFPTPGKLAGDRWAHGDRHGALPQHGFARNRSWRVCGTLDEGAVAAVALRLEVGSGDPEWPWRCKLELTYSLRGQVLRIDQRVTNLDGQPMPFGLGFHPYFAVPQEDKARATIETRATRAFDNVTKQDVTLSTIDLTRPEVDLHLLDHDATASALTWGEHCVRLSGSREYTRWVVWTRAGQDFVCLEPWTSPGDGINRGEILTVEPGEARALFVEIAYERGR